MDEQTLCVFPSKLKGTIAIPSSKSHSLRALLFAMMGRGTSRIANLLPCTDTETMMRAIQLFGTKIVSFSNHVEVTGEFGPASGQVDAGQSGLVLRLIGGLAGLLPHATFLKGDEKRPMTPLLSALEQLGAQIDCSPLAIRGPIRPGKAILSGIDSQPVSGLLIATSFLEGDSEIIVHEPCEQPWIELTLSWLHRLGAKIEHQNYEHYWIQGGLSYEGFDYVIPGDFSSAAFALAAALVTNSILTLTGLDFSDVQGDKIFIDWLQELGADITIDKTQLTIRGDRKLKGGVLDLNLCIDALPILAVLGCFGTSEMYLKGAAGARLKESDRIHAICIELKKMGACIEEYPDGLRIKPSLLRGAELSSHKDHRIAMSLAIAAMGAEGASHISGSSCINKTYPTFIRDFQKIGAHFEMRINS